MPKRFSTSDPQIIMYADGTFYVRIRDRERSLKTKDFGVAQRRKKDALAKLDLTGTLSSRLKCGDVWADYEAFRAQSVDDVVIGSKSRGAHRRRKTIAPGTMREIRNLWRLHLSKFWSQVRFDKIDEEKWLEYVEFTDVIDLANHRKVMSGFLKWAKGKRFVKFVPDMPIPAVERRERRVLKPAEIRKLFLHARGSVLIFISMYLFMGMRRKEIMTLRWSGIHLDESYLVLVKSVVKTRRGRSLPINKFVHDLLVERKRTQTVETDYVFPNAKDPDRHADVSGLKTAWRTIMKRCGFEPGYVTPHDLRATFEAYAHKATAFTDTQREKFAGAAIDVQKKTYVRFDASDVRGLEAVVEVEGLSLILEQRLKDMGKTRGETNNKDLH